MKTKERRHGSIGRTGFHCSCHLACAVVSSIARSELGKRRRLDLQRPKVEIHDLSSVDDQRLHPTQYTPKHAYGVGGGRLTPLKKITAPVLTTAASSSSSSTMATLRSVKSVCSNMSYRPAFSNHIKMNSRRESRGLLNRATGLVQTQPTRTDQRPQAASQRLCAHCEKCHHNAS